MAEDVVVPTGELGVSGLRAFAGYLQEEFDPKLRGSRGMEAFREMRDNSPAVGAALHAIEIALRNVRTEVIPFSRERADVERAGFVDTCLHDMSFTWSETRSEQLTMLPFGFALCELVYKRREGFNDRGVLSSKHNDGRIGWAKIPLRGQETIKRWEIDDHGGIRGAYQVALPNFDERFLPIEKCLLFRVTKEKNNPEGRGLLRSAAWPWYCSKRLTEIMLIGAERDLAGLAVVRVPGRIMKGDAPPEEKAAFEAYKDLARNIRRGEQEGVVLPSDRSEGGQSYHYDIQLLASGGKREFNVPEMVGMFDRWIATVLLADLLLMGHQAVGSYALAKGKTGLFEQALNGYLDTIDATYNQHAIPRLMRLNGWPAERSPKLKHKDIAPMELAALADYLSKLTAAGMPLFPDPELERHLREAADLPPAPATSGTEPKRKRESEEADDEEDEAA